MSDVQITLKRNPSPASDEQREQLMADPGFGRVFTDHMGQVRWTADGGWGPAEIVPYGPLSIDPSAAVLHYGQSIFEGYKAYHRADGSIGTFRPDANARRFARSAARLALPEVPADLFIGLADELIRVDRAWVPEGGERSLYIRPLMFGAERFLGVRPSSEVLFLVMAFPAGAYFAAGVKPVTIWLSEEYTRAAPGGTGAAKCAGNYAASLAAQQEAIANGCDQVAFVDAVERRWIEELGGMNLFFVQDDGTIITPELTGTILEGVTRDALLTIAGELGHKVDERRIDIAEWKDGVASGRIVEVFACGTAAVITPVGTLKWRGGEVRTPGTALGPVAEKLRGALLDIQTGQVPDTHGWIHTVS